MLIVGYVKLKADKPLGLVYMVYGYMYSKSQGGGGGAGEFQWSAPNSIILKLKHRSYQINYINIPVPMFNFEISHPFGVKIC